jgi:predicted MFS family arabinose efflux permease
MMSVRMISLVQRFSPYHDVLRVRPFRTLLIGQGLSMAGDAVCLAALPVAMMRNGFGGGTLGSILAAVGIGTVFGAMVGGVLAERSPQRVLVATDAARGMAQVVVAMLIVCGTPSWALVVSYLVFGIGIGISRPCTQVLLTNLLPRNSLVAGNGTLSFVDNFVAVVFPATLGVLIILWDPVWGVLIDGITFFVAAAFTALLPDEGSPEPDDEFSIRRALNGVTVVAGNSELSVGFAATVIMNVLCFPVFLVVAPYAVSDRFSDTMWGVCLAASGLGACIGSVVTVLTSGHRHLTALALTCGLFLGTALALLTGWATAMQTHSPEKDLGKVVAVDTLVTGGAHPFVYLGGGLIGQAVGYSHALTIAAAVSAMGTAAVGMVAIWKRKRTIGIAVCSFRRTLAPRFAKTFYRPLG